MSYEMISNEMEFTEIQDKNNPIVVEIIDQKIIFEYVRNIINLKTS